jgi:hypothetical protein
MTTIQAALDTINAECPSWLELDAITQREDGKVWARFKRQDNESWTGYTSVLFDSVQELLAEVTEVLPTISEDKMNIFGTSLFQYINGDMIGDKEVSKIIDRVVIEELSNGRDKADKPVVYFKDSKKGWVLNKSSARAIADVIGPETDNWRGASVVLTAEKIYAFGKQQNVIRVVRVAKARGGKAVEVTQTQDDLLDAFAEQAPNSGAYAE